MKLAHKYLLIFSIGVLSISITKTSFGQYPGMGAFRAQQNQQFINQQMRMQMQMLNMRGVTATLQEYDFNVTMRDSTTKEITSAIYTDSVTKKHFIVWVDKKYKKSDTNRYKKIYPIQTLSLTCVLTKKDEDNPGSYLPGKITDSCWMFKTLSGAINVYTYDGYNDAGQADQTAIVGIQLNNGPVLQFNEGTLKTMVGQNAKALELIADKKYLRAIKRYNKDIEKGTGN
jgi:hypothetical protein